MSPLDVDRSVSRSWSKRGSYVLSTVLTPDLISEALLASEDHGLTLVFTKKGLTGIGVDAAEQLAMIGRGGHENDSCIERVALGHNRLTALPQEFALLSRLRYLNLKGNSFIVFPHVLTLMPSLDTLDISSNKIKKLPADPGQLVSLRVFCFSRNKVTRLPAYMPKFQKLSILELDRNPIEWPPKSVMERPTKFAVSDDMKAWIRNLFRWMEVEFTRSPPRSNDDSGYSDNLDLESNLEDSFNSWSQFPHSESEMDEVTPHARSFSIDSNFSVSSIAESDLETPSSSYGQIDRPPPLRLGMLQSSYSTETSPTQSIESYLPSPADSDTFFDNTTANVRQDQQHARNASYAHGPPKSANLADLPGKKSMPDLRTAKLNFSKKVPDLPDRGTSTTPMTSQNRVNRTNDEFSMPSPLSQRQDSGSSGSSMSKPTLKYLTKEPVPPTQPASAQASPTRPVPSMAFERNSYFRRISTLPVSSSSSLPEPLLCLIESARSLLFAACQIYQSLEHYTIHTIDERLSSVLRKVLDPASADMMQLINSLDRFDAMSRKMLPPPAVCRGVVEGCRDTVAAFGKAISVLSLQLKVISTADDVRYLRSMMLMLYGASAEISCAWQKMLPHMEAIRPLLHAKPFPSPAPPGLLTGLNTSEQPLSATPTSSSRDYPPLRTNPTARTHTARRHAGSFSFKDVEIGRSLPSEPPPFSRTALHTPKLRRPQPNASVTVTTPTPPGALSLSTSTSSITTDTSAVANHSRSGSQVSLQASSSSSSPSVPQKSSFLELPAASKVQVDKEALHAVQEAVEVAPVVWSMMEDMLGHVLEAKPDVREDLERARAVTKRLAEMIRSVQDGDTLSDRKALREDAHMFLKCVVNLSNILKKYGGAHSSALRMNMVKLTNSTEEFAILLHVSSFSPASTPRTHSPMYNTSGLGSQSQVNLLGPPTPDENRLTSSLSRSRSAQASITVKVSPQFDAPRSALPTQSFKLPAIRRLRENRLDGNDLG